MYKVDLYTENAGKCPKKQDGWYGYVLQYQGKQLYTIEKFEKCEANRYQRDLIMFREALIKCKDCELTVHTESTYLKNYERLEQYIENDWKRSNGKPVKNVELWEQIAEYAKGKKISFAFGPHEYTGWLQNEIRRKKNV